MKPPSKFAIVVVSALVLGITGAIVLAIHASRHTHCYSFIAAYLDLTGDTPRYICGDQHRDLISNEARAAAHMHSVHPESVAVVEIWHIPWHNARLWLPTRSGQMIWISVRGTSFVDPDTLEYAPDPVACDQWRSVVLANLRTSHPEMQWLNDPILDRAPIDSGTLRTSPIILAQPVPVGIALNGCSLAAFGALIWAAWSRRRHPLTPPQLPRPEPAAPAPSSQSPAS